MDGMQHLTGSLTGTSITNVTSISGSTLQTIGGNLTLASGTLLNSLNFPALSSVGGISFTALGPGYQNLGFGNVSQIGGLSIIDTYLQSLTGISMTSGNAIDIAQNQYLNNITLETKTLTGLLSLSANANGQAAVSLPDLTSAGGIDIRNASSVALPVLANTTSGDVSLVGNNFQSLSLPALTSTNGLTVENNNQMSNMSVPKLGNVGASVNVWNNSALTGAINFPVLTNVVGSVYVVGAYSK